jgi:glycosyltransferase involved in cell wall biosynthesis
MSSSPATSRALGSTHGQTVISDTRVQGAEGALHSLVQGSRLGGFVITYNEEASIEACLRSMHFCDELLVIDAHSTDRTCEIAERCGARVIKRAWKGYRSQREFALRTLQSDWILYLDADERVSPKLAEQIRALPLCEGMSPAAYRIPFRTVYFGRVLRFGDTRSESHVRLFNLHRAKMSGFEIHEKVVTDGMVGHLRGWIDHDSYKDLDDHIQKFERYAKLMAEEQFLAGKRSSWWRVFVSPLWRFLRAFVFRLGFLDGWRGLAMALMATSYVHQKYRRLLVLSRCKIEAR